jgi:hypothetical protein
MTKPGEERAKTLDEIVPADAPQGAGVFCRLSDGRYVFALYDTSRAEGGRGLIVGRIGGQRKPDETWEGCVRREVFEEACCRAVVESSARCIYADLDGRAEEIAVDADPRPALISRQPPSYGSVAGGVYYNLLFWARLVGEPRPGPELDALVILDEALLRRIARESPSLRELRDAGAEVIGARELDPQAPVSLGRSPQLLLELLDRGRARIIHNPGSRRRKVIGER